jgi:hypothetical protein
MRDVRTYVTSYRVRDDHKELFTIDLNKQLGFYQICEFVAVSGDDHFIIEQTNRVGAPKIATFDKSSGTLLGTFKDNLLVDIDEKVIFTVEPVAKLKNVSGSSNEDFVAMTSDNQQVIALFCPLPRKPAGLHLLTRIKLLLKSVLKSAPRDVVEVLINDESCCDRRVLIAIAMIIHDRGGIH